MSEPGVRTCTVLGCEKAAQARGMCPMHYQRSRKHGAVDTVKRGGPARTVDAAADAPRECGHCQALFTPAAGSIKARRARRYCSPTCRNEARRKGAGGWLDGRYEAELNTGCWLWTGLLSGAGYGRASFQGKSDGAHRIAYRLFRGEPGGLHVLHRCDTPVCVNPAHLFLGTHADNVRDMNAKGRGRPGGRGR